jgi:hypothetical protein
VLQVAVKAFFLIPKSAPVSPTPLVVLVQVSAGILNFVVTLRAPVGVNVHPPKLVLVAFARRRT